MADKNGNSNGEGKRERRGGRRAGAGRPRELPGPPGIPWTKVRRFARLGADRDRIVKALGITVEQLREPAVLERLQAELDRGAAQHDIDLLAHAERMRRGGPGKVSVVLQPLKHRLGYNAPGSNKGKDQAPPDLENGVAELERILRRVRR